MREHILACICEWCKIHMAGGPPSVWSRPDGKANNDWVTSLQSAEDGDDTQFWVYEGDEVN